MNKYAIFIDDCEIHLDLEIGDFDSLDAIREVIEEYWQNIGQQGKYKNRAIWRRLGTSRDRIFEVVVSDPVKAVIVSANLKSSAGDN